MGPNRCGTRYKNKPETCDACGWENFTQNSPIIEKIAYAFKFDGVQRTLRVKIGKKISTTSINVDGRTIEFKRTAVSFKRR